jgi:glucose-6-phosphate isomerase
MPGRILLESHLGTLAGAVDAAVARMQAEDIVSRIWVGDHTVWKPEPKEITNRLGWLKAPAVMQERLEEIEAFVDDVRHSGMRDAVLLGMGGSSLAPEVLSRMFPARDGFLNLTVLDTTHPQAIARVQKRLDLSKTLFVVSTKSGGTVETLSLFKYFYNEVSKAMGAKTAGSRFCAVTDPSSGLETLARFFGFRKIFQNDPNVGGRYSALTFFGLVPAALLGIDLREMLDHAATMADACRWENGSTMDRNPGLWLGAVLGTAALEGRDKVTFFVDPGFANLADWVEQLLAESTGKDGTGILPVVDEPLGEASAYGPDRLFVIVSAQRGHAKGWSPDPGMLLREAGFPTVSITAGGPWDVGALFFLWEFATVVAGHLLRINPFDQPNVESAKVQAKKMLAAYKESGRLPEVPTAFRWNDFLVLGEAAGSNAPEALRLFADAVADGGYLGVHAYVAPSSDVDGALRSLQKALRDRTKKAVTVGYGPRFLHSTGQLHKGDAGKGAFIQITDDPSPDLPIPDEAGRKEASVSFGTLIAAQALGDREALLAAGRRVLRFHITGQVAPTLHALVEAL